MADPVSYLRLLEEGEQIDYLLKSPDLSDDEKEELQHIWNSLKSRKESKFDAIIGVITVSYTHLTLPTTPYV